ncbi:MAG: aminotransferase class IV [Verrucomicrobia bacterium]|nr:aminotransferase class IV [Verrucomicrobiota bacterium]
MFYVNGAFVQEDEAKISVLDLAILRGFCVFEYMRTYRGKPFHLEDHLLRLKHSATQIGLQLPHSLEEIAEIVYTLLRSTPSPESSIKILITGGISPDQFYPSAQSSLIAFNYPLVLFPESDYENGIRTITTNVLRPYPSCKSTQYIGGVLAMQKGKELKAKEALYVNPQGKILEATTSNFFGYKNGTLYTYSSPEVLTGITREVVLREVKGKLPVVNRPILYEEIPELEEAFITSSTKEVMPVVQIDDHPIGSGQVGPVSREIRALFKSYSAQEQWPMLNISLT